MAIQHGPHGPDIPLVNIQKIWKITIFNGKIHYKWPFSIAMLVYQRVTIITWHPVLQQTHKTRTDFIWEPHHTSHLSHGKTLPAITWGQGGWPCFLRSAEKCQWQQIRPHGSAGEHQGQTFRSIWGPFAISMQSLDSYCNFRCFRPRHSKTCFWKRDLWI
jgi:hypothetical protein